MSVEVKSSEVAQAQDDPMPEPLESPTGSRRTRPATAWIIGLFAAVALASIVRHLLH